MEKSKVLRQGPVHQSLEMGPWFEPEQELLALV